MWLRCQLKPATQARRRLAHLPYANWCRECDHRARPDRHERTDGTKRGCVPEVSFDFCYTTARDSETKSARAACWLVAIDSQTGLVHVVPLGSKNQFRLIAQEAMSFSQTLKYSAATYRRHHETTTRQSLKMLINSCLSVGLTTRMNPSKLGDHSFLSRSRQGEEARRKFH